MSLDLDAIRAREQAATEGPWHAWDQQLAARHGWHCQPIPGRTDVVEVSTGRVWPDAEPVRVLLRVDEGETVVASDGGRCLLRLRDAGFDMDEPVNLSLWEEALRSYRVNELDDRIFVQADVEKAAHAVNRLADAMLAIDGLRAVCDPLRIARATNARLNRRAQIAEACITELVTGTGRGKAKRVAAEVWERCTEAHEGACRMRGERDRARETACRLEAELARLREQIKVLADGWDGTTYRRAPDMGAPLSSPRRRREPLRNVVVDPSGGGE